MNFGKVLVKPDWDKWAIMKKHFEGLFLTAYQDTGKIWTIGYGSTFNHIARRKVIKGDRITYQDAIEFMRIDATEVVRLANVYIHRPLNSHQSTAVCDYIYNRGIGNFLKADLNGLGLDETINANPLDPHIADIIKGTGLKDKLGRLLPGLIRRRKSQAHLYFTGELKFQF